MSSFLADSVAVVSLIILRAVTVCCEAVPSSHGGSVGGGGSGRVGIYQQQNFSIILELSTVSCSSDSAMLPRVAVTVRVVFLPFCISMFSALRWKGGFAWHYLLPPCMMRQGKTKPNDPITLLVALSLSHTHAHAQLYIYIHTLSLYLSLTKVPRDRPMQ